MSIKRYCDVCGSEAESVTGTRLTSLRHRGNFDGAILVRQGRPKVRFEIMCGVGDSLNGGDLCKYCLIDAINTLDDRPQQAVA